MPISRTPVTFAVAVAIAITSILLIATATIAGAYLVAIDAVHKSQATATALQQREAQSSIRSSIPICQALQDMDNASKPPVSNASNDPLSYGHKLATAIHGLYVKSYCGDLLADAAQDHGDYAKVLQQLTQQEKVHH